MPNGLEDFLDEAERTGGIAPDIEYTISLYTIAEGNQKKAGIYGGSRCTATTVLNICGSARTGRSGEAVLDLEDFICTTPLADDKRRISAPTYFVATPYSVEPAFLTFTIDIQDQQTDPKFQINVFSWDADGKPNPNTAFNWHCCVNILTRQVD